MAARWRSSHGIKDRVAIVGMGCTPFAEHWDKGLDDLLVDAANEAFASAGIDKDDVDAYWLGTAQSGMSGITLARPLQLRRQAGHPRRELLRHRLRGAAPGRLRGGLGRLRRRDGGRRREGEGLRLPGAQRRPDPERRHRPHAHRRGDVLDGARPAYGKKYGVDDDEMREVLARIASKNHATAPATRGPSSAGDVDGDDLRRARSGGRPRCVRLRRRGRRRGRRDRRAGRGRPPLHRQAALRQGAVVRRRQRLRASPTRPTTTRLPRDRGHRRRRLRAGRHHRPARASSPWPRCTTASPRPSSC